MFITEENETREGACYRIGTTDTGVYFNVRLRPPGHVSRADIRKCLSRFSYEPEDALEWALVLDEIKGFIKADAAVSVLHADSNPIVLSHRCVKNSSSSNQSSFFVVVLIEFISFVFGVVIEISFFVFAIKTAKIDKRIISNCSSVDTTSTYDL